MLSAPSAPDRFDLAQLRRTQGALAALRMLLGVLWLSNLLWKLPPDFGRYDDRGLLYSFRLAERYAVGPLADLVHDVVIPHFTLFGWLVFVVEASAGILLLLGLATRLGALIGLGQAVAITLLVGNAPDEWRWGYALFIAVHVLLLSTPCAARFSLDATRARRL